jgi:hypothetical protein
MPRSLVRSVANRLRRVAKRFEEQQPSLRRRSSSVFRWGPAVTAWSKRWPCGRSPIALRQFEITDPRACRPVVSFSIGGEPYDFDGRLQSAGSRPRPADGEIVQDFIQNKVRVKALLHANRFSVPEGAAFACEDRKATEAFFTDFVSSRPQGVCLKPTRGWWGRQVYLGVRDLASFRAAWQRISEPFDHVLIEEMAAGEMHRVFCVGGRAIAAISWRTMNVVGDGRHTIEELVACKNVERKLNPAYAGYPLELGRQELRFLQQAGSARLMSRMRVKSFISDPRRTKTKPPTRPTRCTRPIRAGRARARVSAANGSLWRGPHYQGCVHASGSGQLSPA